MTREEIERQIATCRDAEELKILTKQFMDVTGAHNHFADPSVSGAASPTAPLANGKTLAESGYAMEREIFVSGHPRMLVRGNSKEELDRLEADALFENR
jgi:hypothetical protein